VHLREDGVLDEPTQLAVHQWALANALQHAPTAPGPGPKKSSDSSILVPLVGGVAIGGAVMLGLV